MDPSGTAPYWLLPPKEVVPLPHKLSQSLILLIELAQTSKQLADLVRPGRRLVCQPLPLTLETRGKQRSCIFSTIFFYVLM